MQHRNMSEALPAVLHQILTKGSTVGSRLGETTKELTPVHLTLDHPLEREVLTPGRKASYPAQIAETMWVLAGRDDIEWLSHYLPRAKDFSDDGATWRAAYGARIRKWGGDLDQLAHVVDLLKAETTTRRAVITLYDPKVDSAPGKDIPCNNWLHFISRAGRLDLHVAVRSNDAMWGLSGINAFEWSVLLEVVARLTYLEVGSLHFSTTSLHLYDRHFTKAQQIVDKAVGAMDRAAAYPNMGPLESVGRLDALLTDWFKVEAAIRANEPARRTMIAHFSDPLLRAWLYALDYHWNGADLPTYLLGTRMAAALEASPKRKVPNAELELLPNVAEMRATLAGRELGRFHFVPYCAELHRQKSKAYGDSWRRRGEKVGIQANVARKLDRLAGGDTPDENYADTCIDLFIYLAKYRIWTGEAMAAQVDASDDPKAVAHELRQWDTRAQALGHVEPTLAREKLETLFAQLEQLQYVMDRARVVEKMLPIAAALARQAWLKRQVWKDGNAQRVWAGYED